MSRLTRTPWPPFIDTTITVEDIIPGHHHAFSSYHAIRISPLFSSSDGLAKSPVFSLGFLNWSLDSDALEAVYLSLRCRYVDRNALDPRILLHPFSVAMCCVLCVLLCVSCLLSDLWFSPKLPKLVCVCIPSHSSLYPCNVLSMHTAVDLGVVPRMFLARWSRSLLKGLAWGYPSVLRSCQCIHALRHSTGLPFHVTIYI